MSVRIFLAWQTIADGRRQIRKWSPDTRKFFGYEKQTFKALDWLKWNKNPEWEKIKLPYPETPYETLQIEKDNL